MWSHGRTRQGQRRDRRKEQWNSEPSASAEKLHWLAYQCKWRNHESKIREWKIAEYSKH